MIRQNPVQKKRSELNLKRRLFTLSKEKLPPPSVSENPPPDSSSYPDIPPVEEIPVEATASPPPPSVPADISDSDYEHELEYYQVSQILSSLLAGSSSERMLRQLHDGLAKAKERGDDFYAAVFEGGIAANQEPIDVDKAVESYRQAYSLLERFPNKSDGFLHALIWDLYVRTENNDVVGELLDRARSEWMNLPRKRIKSLLRQTTEELRQLPEFRQYRDEYERERKKRSDSVVRRLSRDGRLSKDRSLLLFPRRFRVRPENEERFRSFSMESQGKNFYISFAGNGTVVNPDLSFPDDFYRIGGSLGDIRHFIFTTPFQLDLNGLNQLHFLLMHRRDQKEKIRFFVTPDAAKRSAEPLDSLEKAGSVDISIMEPGAETNLQGGGTFRMMPGSLCLKSPSGRTIQIIEASDLFSPAILRERPDILILPETELFYSIALARELCPGLALYGTGDRLDTRALAPSIQEYLGPEIAWTVASPTLVCDPENGCFLDIVKSFASLEDCWTGYGKLAAEVVEEGDMEGIYYFERGAEGRFDEERTAILDTFRYHRNRREGLYFQK